MKIDLVIDATRVPGRSESPPEAPRLPTFEACIARGEPIALEPAADLQAFLLRLFGVDDTAAPIAALTLIGDNHPAGYDYWLRIDPVCLQATRTRILLLPLPDDDLSLAEAQTLTAALAPHLASDGHQLVLGHPQRWYLRCARPQQLHTRSPAACAGALVEQHLAAGADGAYWRRLVTEAQMLLHPLAVNAARESNGRLAANGIWPWGGGRVLPVARCPYQRVCSDDPLARGLARAAGSDAAPAPRNADAAIAAAMPGSATLIVLSVAPGSEISLERDWLQPLASALAHGSLAELGLRWLRDSHPLARRLTRAHMRRWWRRTRPLSHYA